MGDGHDHGSITVAEHTGSAYRRRMLISFGLIGSYFVVELIAGLLTNSLALLADAGHMLTDFAGLGMAVAATHLATRSNSTGQRTFGFYRLEVLAALANALLLFVVAVMIVLESFRRLQEPTHVDSGPMLIVAIVGLLINLVVFALLREGARESLNVEAAYMEVLADTLGSVGVISAAVIIRFTGFVLVDAIFGVAIGIFVLPRTWRLARRALRILLQGAPEGIDVERVATSLVAAEGVVAVHDLHIWCLTSGMEVASAHVVRSPSSDSDEVLKAVGEIMREQHSIAHATIQVELKGGTGSGECPRLAW